MNKKIVAALNKQIAFEMESAYLYLAMSLRMNEEKLPGYGAWLMKQYEEEMMHAFKMITYLQDQDQPVELATLKPAKVSQTTGLEIAKSVLTHEKAVTAKINDLYTLALEERDYATREFLGWFVTEQVEEEKTARSVIDLFEFAGDNKSAILFVDAQLAGRQ